MSNNAFIEKLLHFSEKHALFSPDDGILLAVSGGIDSMCMLHVMAGICKRLHIAHCNFQLRGEESEEDELFVQRYAAQLDIPCVVKRFNVTDYASENGVSIQMAARELRYSWFGKLRQELNLKWIATAHHQDDEIEGFFIQLFRGTGLRGLMGIPVRRGRVIRPFLAFRRTEIAAFASSNGILFREDTSNITSKYLRNAIRNRILPLLEEVTPLVGEGILKTQAILRKEEQALAETLQQLWSDHWHEEGNAIYVQLPGYPLPHTFRIYMYRKLLNLGFTTSQLQDLLEGEPVQTGGIFISPLYRLLVDRDNLVISRRAEEEKESRNVYTIKALPCTVTTPVGRLHLSLVPRDAFEESMDPNKEFIHYIPSMLPLTLRLWQPGDKFQPLGMKGRQKLKDFLTNQKASRFDKDQVYVLTKGNDVIWVVGYRLDHKYRVRNDTEQLMMASWEELTDTF